MNLAAITSTPSPIVARFVDTEVAGMYHGEIRLGPVVGSPTGYGSVAEAVAAATELTRGEAQPGVAVVTRAGHSELHAVTMQWRDLQSGQFTTGRAPFDYEGYEDAYLQPTRSGRSLDAIVDGDSVFTAR